MRCIFLLLFLSLILSGCGKPASMIEPPKDKLSWFSVLNDACDLGKLAKPVGVDEKSFMWSSSLVSNKASLSHLAAEIQGDMDHGNFISVNRMDDYSEAVLAEADGCGMITWMWSANPVGTLCVYIDDKPAYITSFKSFIDGSFLPVGQPFCGVTSLGHNLSFPIIHRRHLKLTLRATEKELASLYYQIAWNKLGATDDIQVFDPSDIKENRAALREIADKLTAAGKQLDVGEIVNAKTQNYSVAINGHSSFRVDLGDKYGAIKAMLFTWAGEKPPSNIAMEARWTNTESAVSIPINYLVGVSELIEDSDALPASVKGSKAVSRWYMPFSPDSDLQFVNAGADRVNFNLTLLIEDRNPSVCSLYFHAKHMKRQSLQSDTRNILTFADVVGAGRFVGCIIRVDNNTGHWWGEGDHIIWLDDAYDPAWRGTGTEDYFGFAWCTRGIFYHPFRGETRAPAKVSNGVATMHRYHILDTLPFHSYGKFQMEAWGLASGTIDYEGAVLWYQ